MFLLAPTWAAATTAALGPFGLDVRARGFNEHCVKLDAGERVRYRYSANGETDFNIHYHVGKEAEFPAKQAQARSGQDILRVAVREDYCWMWSNKSSGRARIDVLLQRQS